MFGYTLINKKRLEQLEEAEDRVSRLNSYKYWFTGWMNVFSVLDEFSQGNVGAARIGHLRREFAETMGTDEWGRKAEKK